MQLLPNKIICDILNLFNLKDLIDLKKALPDHVDAIINRNYVDYFKEAMADLYGKNDDRKISIMPIKKEYTDLYCEFIMRKEFKSLMFLPDELCAWKMEVGCFVRKVPKLANFLELHSSDIIIKYYCKWYYEEEEEISDCEDEDDYYFRKYSLECIALQTCFDIKFPDNLKSRNVSDEEIKEYESFWNWLNTDPKFDLQKCLN